MNKTIGFIGAGNMTTSIIKGLVNSQKVKASQITIFDRHPEKMSLLKKEFGIKISTSTQKLVETVDILVIAIKPKDVIEMLEGITQFLQATTTVISLAAGVTLKQLEECVGDKIKLIRAMPNTPVAVQEGMTALAVNQNVTAPILKSMVELFSSFGRCEVVEESLFHAVVGVSGSSPAYVFILIEAMADAAVHAGMNREQAYQFAGQAVLGAAKMVLETKQHPAVLKDQVCSPGGTTIEAVNVLNKEGFRGAVMKAIEKCVKRSKSLTQRCRK